MKYEFRDNEMIKGVVQHMNDDHSGACLTIVRALGNVPSAVSASMLGMDAEGVDFAVLSASGAKVQSRVVFAKPLSHEGQIRGHLVAMTKRARILLGTEHQHG